MRNLGSLAPFFQCVELLCVAVLSFGCVTGPKVEANAPNSIITVGNTTLTIAPSISASVGTDALKAFSRSIDNSLSDASGKKISTSDAAKISESAISEVEKIKGGALTPDQKTQLQKTADQAVTDHNETCCQ